MKKNTSLVTKCCELIKQNEVFKGCLLSYEVLNEVASIRLGGSTGFDANDAIGTIFPVWKLACEESVDLITKLTQKQCGAGDVLSKLTLLKFANGSLQKLLISGGKKQEL